MDNRHICEEYAKIGAELIQVEAELEHIRDSDVSIVYLSSGYKKTKAGGVVRGQCEKIQDKYKWGIPADFTVTIFEPNIEGFTDEQLRILIFHELMHVGIDRKEDGTEVYSIRPHDLEDFRYIVDRFGAGWDEV